MTEESAKTYVFDSAKSMDPATLLAMMNNGGMGGNNWMWIIFLFFLYGWGGNGLLGRGATAGALARDFDTTTLLNAINGNGNAISNLSTSLGCSTSQIQSAINSLNNSINSVANTVGMSGQQVISAILQGNQAISQLMAQCCCDNKLLITNMGYEGQLRDQTNTCAITNRISELANGVLTGFAQVGYQQATDTCAITTSVKDQTQTIMDKLSSMEANAQLDKINSLTAQLTAANSRAERLAELAPIYQLLSAIKAGQPSTVAVPYPQLTAVPSYIMNGYSYNTGAWA